MPIVVHTKETFKRFSKYVHELIDLFKRFDIKGDGALTGLWKAVISREFRKECKRIFIEVAEHDGGKLALPTVLAIIGAAMGGVGVAALGGAFGIPLALLLGLIGYPI